VIKYKIFLRRFEIFGTCRRYTRPNQLSALDSPALVYWPRIVLPKMAVCVKVHCHAKLSGFDLILGKQVCNG
jgi:hypothetical protein